MPIRDLCQPCCVKRPRPRTSFGATRLCDRTLWGASVEAGHLSPTWMTFRQAKELGAHVRKGETGHLVV